MPIGDNQFIGVSDSIADLQQLHSITVQLKKYSNLADDIYGEPTTTITSFVRVMITSCELKIIDTEAGGRPIEALYMTGETGIMKENDTVIYNNHEYDIRQVTPFYIGGIIAGQSYTGIRSVTI